MYSAYDEELDRRIAIKVLRSRVRGDAQSRMLREAQALAKLSHPNVVAIYEVGRFGDSLSLAMEFIEGRRVGGDPQRSVLLLSHTGNIHFLRGALPEARATLEQAPALGERSFGAMTARPRPPDTLAALTSAGPRSGKTSRRPPIRCYAA